MSKWNINEIYFERAKKLPQRDSRLSQKYIRDLDLLTRETKDVFPSG